MMTGLTPESAIDGGSLVACGSVTPEPMNEPATKKFTSVLQRVRLKLRAVRAFADAADGVRPFADAADGVGEKQKSRDGEATLWRVHKPDGGQHRVRANLDFSSPIVSHKCDGAVFRGCDRGEWVELVDEPGFTVKHIKGITIVRQVATTRAARPLPTLMIDSGGAHIPFKVATVE